MKCLVCSARDPQFEWPALLCMFLDNAHSLCSVFSGLYCTSTAFEFWHKRGKVMQLAINYVVTKAAVVALAVLWHADKRGVPEYKPVDGSVNGRR